MREYHDAHKPFELTDQQIEFILAGFAAFVDTPDIMVEFIQAFPDTAADLSEQDVEWKSRLSATITKYNPALPGMSLALSARFSALRKHYLADLEGTYLGHARNRLAVMDNTIRELDRLAEDPELAIDAHKLKISVLKEARAEANNYYNPHGNTRPVLTLEEATSIMRSLPMEKYEEYVRRFEDGEDQNVILHDLREESTKILPTNDEPSEEVLQEAEDMGDGRKEEHTETKCSTNRTRESNGRFSGKEVVDNLKGVGDGGKHPD